MEAVTGAILSKGAEIVTEKVTDMIKGYGKNKKTSTKGKGKSRKGTKPRAQSKPRNAKPKLSKRVDRAIPVRAGANLRRPYIRSSLGRDRELGECLTIEGREYAGLLTVPSNTNMAFQVFSLPLNPLMVPGSRLAVESQLWTKFRFEQVWLEFTPLVGSQRDGCLLFSHIDDVELTLPQQGSGAYVDALMQSAGSFTTQVWRPAVHSWKPPKTDKKEYYITPDINDEARFTMQADIKIANMKQTGSGEGYDPGFLTIKYRIKFYAKTLSNSIADNWNYYGVNSTAATSGSLLMNNVNASTSLTFQGNAGMTKLSAGGIYVCWFNFTFGGIRPMDYYYFVAASPITNTWKLYNNLQSAQDLASYDDITGSNAGSNLPTNALMYFMVASSQPMPNLAPTKRGEELKSLRRALQDVEQLKRQLLGLSIQNVNNQGEDVEDDLESDEDPPEPVRRVTKKVHTVKSKTSKSAATEG